MQSNKLLGYFQIVQKSPSLCLAISIFLQPMNTQRPKDMKRAAILDLGTNTFNLLIVEANRGNPYTILVNKKLPVKLGEGGINSGHIAPNAYQRGLQAIQKHYNTIQDYGVQHVKAFGTSALRSAKNGPNFMSDIVQQTGIEIEIISGEREAELIYLGVRQTLTHREKPFLILDIGGGSNEFIVADMEHIYWKKSYPLGIARLLEKFSPSDPITLQEIESIQAYLREQLADLFQVILKYKIDTLIGASGSFETFVSMIKELDVVETEGATDSHSVEIALPDFELLTKTLLKSTHAERENMKGLEPMRIEMIVLASLFVKFILDNHDFNLLLQSNFALKEGAIYELIKEQL